MLRIHESKSPGAAKRYFTEGLARGDYYMDGDEVFGCQAGVWGGRLAEMMNLSGEVTGEAFRALCENQRPGSGDPLTPRTRADRRVGYDFTFNCAKPESIVSLVKPDVALLQAFPSVVADTMALVETDARTRVRLEGKNEERITAHLVWATFVHYTTRPVDGIPDPHLHAHVFVFNATFDPVERRIKAVDLASIKANASYYESVFHSRMAQELQKAGYETRMTASSRELVAVSPEMVTKFSRRTREIEAVAAARGITDPKQKSELGAKTRRRKSESLPMAVVQADWNSRLTDAERAAIVNAKSASQVRAAGVDVDALLSRALQERLKHRSLTTEKQLIEAALRIGLGQATVAQIQSAIGRTELIRRYIDGTEYLTTDAVSQYEQLILSVARDGRGVLPAFAADAPRTSSSDKAANTLVTELMASPDRVTLLRASGVRFPATLENELTATLLSCGHRVVIVGGDAVASPTSPDGSEPRAGSLHHLTSNQPSSVTTNGQTIWVRSADQVPLSDLAILFRVAADSDARIVLAAGSRRTRTAEHGDVLWTLERFAGLRSGERELARQVHKKQRQAYQDFKSGHTAVGLESLNRGTGIRQVRDAELCKTAGQEFARAVRERNSAIIVSNGNESEITREARSALRQNRMLGREQRFEKLTRLGFPEEHLRDPQIYQRGQVVQFFKAAKGFQPGRRYEVLGRDPFGNVLARRGSWVEALPLCKSDRFALYKRSSLELGRGDFVRITCTGRTKNESFGKEKLLSRRGQAIRFANFDMFGIKAPDRRYRVPKDSHHRIMGFTLKGDIKLANGWILPQDFGHLEYGYCVADGQRAIGAFKRALIVDVVSVPGRLPGLAGLESKTTPEIRIITADEERMRFANQPNVQEPEETQSEREISFRNAYGRPAERDFEAAYARQEQQHER